MRGSDDGLGSDRILGRSDAARSAMAARTPSRPRSRDRCSRSRKTGSDSFHGARCCRRHLRKRRRRSSSGNESPRHHHQPDLTLLPAAGDDELQEELAVRHRHSAQPVGKVSPTGIPVSAKLTDASRASVLTECWVVTAVNSYCGRESFGLAGGAGSAAGGVLCDAVGSGSARGASGTVVIALSGFSRWSLLGPRPSLISARESGTVLLCQP